MNRNPGLTGLKLIDLERLLRAAHKGQLQFPIDYRSLALAGLSYLQDKVDYLQGMDEATVKAVLIAVIHERKSSRTH